MPKFDNNVTGTDCRRYVNAGRISLLPTTSSRPFVYRCRNLIPANSSIAAFPFYGSLPVPSWGVMTLTFGLGTPSGTLSAYQVSVVPFSSSVHFYPTVSHLLIVWFFLCLNTFIFRLLGVAGILYENLLTSLYPMEIVHNPTP